MRETEPVTIPETSRVVHGTTSAYVLLRCRCVPCRNANKAYARKWRARKKAEMAELWAEVERLRAKQ